MTCAFLKGMGLRLTRAARAFCLPTWRWKHPGASTALFNLWLVAEGRGAMHVGGCDYTLRAGDCFFFRQWEPNEGMGDAGNSLVVPYVQFECLDGRGRPQSPPKDDAVLPPRYRRILDLSFFDSLLQRSITAHQAGQNQAAEHWLRTAILEMTRQDALPARTDFEREQSAMIDQIAQDIMRQPAAYSKADALVRRMGYSADHIIRLFRKYRNVTPGEFVIQARIQSACELLRFSDHGIARIADTLGYCDIYAFSKQFRQRTGLSPSGYRQRLRLA